jgi:hypothetical protein
MMSRRYFHTLYTLCVLVLLVAQHGALTHAVWHVYKAHQAQAYADSDRGDAYLSGRESPSKPVDLCAFDLAFGQVLGGTHSACMPAAFAPAVVERIHDLTATRLHVAALSPKSRGPPVLL